MKLTGPIKRLLPHLPEPVLKAVSRWRPSVLCHLRPEQLAELLPGLSPQQLDEHPYLLTLLPAGRSFRWPHYLGNLSIWVDTANEIERAMLNGYEKDVIDAARRFVHSGSCALDVGANAGAVTLLLAELVGATGRVTAVEPGPPFAERLRANLALNPALVDRVVVAQVGLSDAPGTLIWARGLNNRNNGASPSPSPASARSKSKFLSQPLTISWRARHRTVWTSSRLTSRGWNWKY